MHEGGVQLAPIPASTSPVRSPYCPASHQSAAAAAAAAAAVAASQTAPLLERLLGLQLCLEILEERHWGHSREFTRVATQAGKTAKRQTELQRAIKSLNATQTAQ